MRSTTKKVLARSLATMVAAIALLAAVPGCEKPKGPAEKAGEKIDEAVKDTKRAVEDAAD